VLFSVDFEEIERTQVEGRWDKAAAILAGAATALEERFGLQVLVPSQKGMDAVHGIIYGELCKREIEDSSRHTCVQIVGDMAQQGAEGIVLGCTELLMLIRQKDVDVPLFDTTRLHAGAADDNVNPNSSPRQPPPIALEAPTMVT